MLIWFETEEGFWAARIAMMVVAVGGAMVATGLRRRGRLGIAPYLLTVASSLAVLGFGLAVELPGPPRVRVVDTWRQLMAQRPIVVDEDVTVRLGLESRSSSTDEGVLLYALVEGQPAPNHGSDALGPLTTRVVRPVEQLRAVEQRQILSEAFEETDAVLFAKGFSSRDSGLCTIEILGADDEVVARAIVEFVGARRHPWVALDKPSRQQQQQPAGQRRRVGFGMQTMIPRIPSWEGDRRYSVDRTRQGLQNPTTRLPSLIPRLSEETSASCRFEDDGRKLVIDVDTDAQWTVGSPQDHVLFRWWRNGSPIFDAKVYADTESVDELFGRLEELRELELKTELSFHIDDFDPGALGVTTGDRLGLQILYTSQGVCGLGVAERLHQALMSRDHDVFRTERLEITVP